MNVIDNRPVMIFKDEKGKYTVGLSKKKLNSEEYEKAYLKIEFNKGVEFENQTKILIKNAWLDFYKWENESGKGTTWKIKCSDFDVVSEKVDVPNPVTKVDPMAAFKEFGESVQVSEEDLPF